MLLDFSLLSSLLQWREEIECIKVVLCMLKYIAIYHIKTVQKKER